MTPEEWVLSGDTGTSSKTIWAVMMGVVRNPTPCIGKYTTPMDPSDFGRCYRLLKAFPQWEARFAEMAERFPAWAPLVREWPRLTALYETELPKGRCPRLYEAMQLLEGEIRNADGWRNTGPGSWKRGGALSVALGNGVTISSGGEA